MIPKSELSGRQELLFLKLAQELAMDIMPLDKILETHGLSVEEFAQVNRNARFQALLRDAITSWSSALNVEQRILLKTQHLVEMALPEMYGMLLDPDSKLTAAKVELLKAFQRGAGIGAKDQGGGAEKVTITINMGAGEQTQVVANLPTRVIEHEDA